jgi:glycosyltransferase involved in cell wall biosynthesis
MVSQNNQTHGVLIPSYNSGRLLLETVESTLQVWKPVIVVLDGCTDGSQDALAHAYPNEPNLHILAPSENGGKGAAVLIGLHLAQSLGWSHVAVVDSDGQHDVGDIPRFMEASKQNPEAMILGTPIFGEDAPSLRVLGRRVGNWWTQLETWWGGIQDSLYGFRVYPVNASIKILLSIRGGRRFDFDTQLAVRLYWEGYQPLNIPTKVTYKSRESGGVSHFKYFRDNALLTLVHIKLVLLSFIKIPHLLHHKRRRST